MSQGEQIDAEQGVSSQEGSSEAVNPPRARDRHGKQVLRILAAPRLVETEREHTPVVRTDVLLRPGPALPSEAGLLAQFVDHRMALVELFSGRPRRSELWHARAKGLLALDELPLVPMSRPPFGLCQVLIGIGSPHRALEGAFKSLRWRVVEPGLHCYDDVYELVYVDLLRLGLRLETAWLHILGAGPWMVEAFGLLLQTGRELDRRWINTLLSEGRTMPSVQSALRSPELLAEQEYVTRSWELAHASVLAELKGRQEGRQEGQEEGTLKGEREAIRLVLKARFGFVPPDLEPELGRVSSLEALNELITAAATRTVPEVVQLAQRLARPLPSSP
ncbi:MAG: hypothetical protein ACKO6N_04000 [Myxococcota bacterium]